MAPSTGKRLQAARLIRGLSLEDVQHRTRIRLAQLAGMENEDLTVFASRSYARSFYALYGRFLGVDLTEFLGTLESEGLKAVKYHPYLRASPDRVARGRRARPKPAQPRPQARRLALLGTVLALVLGAAAWFGNHHWLHSNPGREGAGTSPDSTPANLPLLAGTGSTPAPSLPALDASETSLANGTVGELRTGIDVRSTPPPVLKALPVDDTVNRRVGTDGENSKDRHPATELRRPAPFTR